MSTTDKQAKISGKARPVTFNVSSPGFLYTVIVAPLTIFAISGVHFPTSAEILAGDITTTLSTGGIFAIIGVIVSSVIFPIYNAFKSGLKFSVETIFRSTLTWVALGNIVASLLALTGLALPDGTIEQIVAAVQAKDWISLGSLLVTTIIPTIVRWIKSRNTQTA